MMSDILRMLEELKSSRAFRRIQRVSFLGIVDHINQQREGSRPAYSRAEHSLGVLKLGVTSLRSIKMEAQDAAHLLAACIVHDMGHPPFSHSLEYAFPKSDRTITHHDILREILLFPMGAEREISRILVSYQVDPVRIFNIIDGNDPISFFFSAPINVDTLDGIQRSMNSFSIFSSYNIEALSGMVARLYGGESISDPRKLLEMDKFWDHKSLFYHVLSSENPLSLAERRFQHVVRRHIKKLDRSHFQMTDKDFISRYPQIMTEFNGLEGPEQIAASQKFTIDNAVRVVDKNSVYNRYVRIKHENRGYRAFAS